MLKRWYPNKVKVMPCYCYHNYSHIQKWAFQLLCSLWPDSLVKVSPRPQKPSHHCLYSAHYFSTSTRSCVVFYANCGFVMFSYWLDKIVCSVLATLGLGPGNPILNFDAWWHLLDISVLDVLIKAFTVVFAHITPIWSEDASINSACL